MAKHWKKNNKSKKKNMSIEQIENGELNKDIREKEAEKVEPQKFSAREYKSRFVRINAYRLPEDSKIHCGNGTELTGVAGDYYVCLDQVHELVMSAELFKKLFLPKIDQSNNL